MQPVQKRPPIAGQRRTQRPDGRLSTGCSGISEHSRGRFLLDGYRIETRRDRMDVSAIHAYLTRSYWAEGIPRDVVEHSLDHSLCFGLFHGQAQVGFARVVTDRATFAYLADVYVLEEHQGKGLGKLLVEVVLRHPDLQGLRRFTLATRDAHGLYAQFGFTPLDRPERYMEIVRADIYRKPGLP